jgi:hypothetical protein
MPQVLVPDASRDSKDGVKTVEAAAQNAYDHQVLAYSPITMICPQWCGEDAKAVVFLS